MYGKFSSTIFGRINCNFVLWLDESQKQNNGNKSFQCHVMPYCVCAVSQCPFRRSVAFEFEIATI
jgi:hypothetical protein